jgi:hypothetical protein
MSRVRYDVQDVRRALDELVESSPDTQDRRVLSDVLVPRYVEHGEPTCLSACIMVKLGVSVNVLKTLDRYGSDHQPVQLASVDHPLRRRFTAEAWDLLAYLQRHNDRGYSWSRCRTNAFDPENRSLRVHRTWLPPEHS